MLNKYIEQLESLSLDDLLIIQRKVDELIKDRTVYPFRTIFGEEYSGHYQGNRAFKTTVRYYGSDRAKTSITSNSQEYTVSSMPDVKVENQQNVSDYSLENVINLVDEWMTDESGYDEEVYPEIENELNKIQASFQISS